MFGFPSIKYIQKSLVYFLLVFGQYKVSFLPPSTSPSVLSRVKSVHVGVIERSSTTTNLKPGFTIPMGGAATQIVEHDDLEGGLEDALEVAENALAIVETVGAEGNIDTDSIFNVVKVRQCLVQGVLGILGQLAESVSLSFPMPLPSLPPLSFSRL